MKVQRQASTKFGKWKVGDRLVPSLVNEGLVTG